MLKGIIGLLVSLMASTAIANVTSVKSAWIAFDDVKITDKVEVQVVKKTWFKMELDILVPGMEAEEVITDKGVFTKLSLQGEGFKGAVGAPKLPVIRRLLEFPIASGIRVNYTAEGKEEVSLNKSGFNGPVIPAQPSRSKCSSEKVEFAYDAQAYMVNNKGSEESVRILDKGILRGHHVFLVEFRPVVYDPVNHRVTYVSNLNVEFTFERPQIPKTLASIKSKYSPVYEKFLDVNLVKESRIRAAAPKSTVPGIGYLVIAADEFMIGLTEWVEWKTKSGYQVTVVKASEAGETVDDVKSFIKNAYEKWEQKPTYVLLVGDTNKVPAFRIQYTDDVAYSDLDDGGYWTPDVLIGRWPARDLEQLQNMVSKSLQYDRLEMPDVTYFSNLVGITSRDNYSLVETTHEFCFEEYIYPLDEANNLYHTVYERLGGDTEDFAQNVNDGRSIVLYSGHGYGDGSGTHSVDFQNYDVDMLKNENMLPHVFVYACGTNLYHQISSFGEHWLQVPEIGSVSFWGTSGNSYWTEDDNMQRKSFKVQFDEGLTRVGEVHFSGLIAVYENQSSRSEYYFKIYNLMGDPTLDVVGRIPVAMDLNIPERVSRETGSIQVSAEVEGSAVEGALVAAYQNGVLLGSGFTNSSGALTIQLIKEPALGDVEIRAKGHNTYPALQTVTVY